jgi:hypothetical protein
MVMANDPRDEGLFRSGDASGLCAETAMGVVARAQRGELSQDDLVEALLGWDFGPSYRTRGLADDWETRPNSFGAVVHAYAIGLIDEETYGRIAARAEDRASRPEGA